MGGRKPFIAAAFVASTGAALWFALTGAPTGVLAARALSGVSATMWVVITVMFASYYPASQAGYAMSLITFVTTLSQLASTLGGGLIAERWGWQAPFIAAVVAGVMGLLFTIPLKEGRASKIGVNASELLKVGTEKGLLIVSGLAILFHFNSYITIFGFVPNYAVSIGATKAQLGYLSLVSTLPNALAALGTGKLFAKRWTERQMVVAGFIMMALATWAITMSDDIRVLYATQAVGGFGRGLIFPVLMGLSIRTVAPERRATAMGFFQSIYALGMFAGPAVSGVIAARSGLAVTFNATAWITIAAAVAAAWLMPKPVQREAAEAA